MNAPRPFHTTRPLAFGLVQSVGLGAFAGGLEAVVLAATLKLPLSTGGFFVLGTLDVLVMAGFAAAVAGMVGAAWFLRPGAGGEDADPVPGWSWQAAITVFALTGWYLWLEAAARIGRGDPVVGALALAAMPIGFAGLGYYNARFWFRWVERNGRPWGLPILAWASSAVLVVGSTIAFGTRGSGGTAGFADDRSAVLVTVDGLGADALPPGIAALGQRPGGIVFADAVTPIPASRPANTTVITGLHPLRHQLFTDDQALSPRFPTLFGEVRREGWPTAGFVSGPAVDGRSGLGEDLRVLDDALTGGSWLGHIELVGWLQQRLGGRGAHRDAPATVGAFAAWLQRRGDGPFVAWIHLDDPPHAARTGGDPDAAVAAVDEAVGELLAALESAGVRDRTLVLVAGTSGLGQVPERGLRDEDVNVPIVLDAPGRAFDVHRVDVQVRTLDVINTVSAYLELAPIDTSEGISLLGYGDGDRSATMSCALVGQDDSGHWLLGLRNNKVKYWIDREGREQLFYLADDPDETTDLTQSEPGVLAQARSVLVSDRAAMQRLLWR